MARVSCMLAASALLAAFVASAALAAGASSFSGQATVLSASAPAPIGKVVLGDTGALPSSGGKLSTSVAAINLPGLATAGVGQASTQGAGNHSRSSASLTDVALSVLGIPITATAIQSQAEARCQAGQPQVSGSSQLANVTVNGTPIAVAALPVALSVLGITAAVDEQTMSTNGATGESTVNALHVSVPLAGIDVVVASSHADITCNTAAP